MNKFFSSIFSYEQENKSSDLNYIIILSSLLYMNYNLQVMTDPMQPVLFYKQVWFGLGDDLCQDSLNVQTVKDRR